MLGAKLAFLYTSNFGKWIRIGPDRAYLLHFTLPQLLPVLQLLPMPPLQKATKIVKCGFKYEHLKGCGGVRNDRKTHVGSKKTPGPV